MRKKQMSTFSFIVPSRVIVNGMLLLNNRNCFLLTVHHIGIRIPSFKRQRNKRLKQVHRVYCIHEKKQKLREDSLAFCLVVSCLQWGRCDLFVFLPMKDWRNIYLFESLWLWLAAGGVFTASLDGCPGVGPPSAKQQFVRVPKGLHIEKL